MRETMHPGRWLWILAPLPALLVFAPLAGRGFDFVNLDDSQYILQNPLIRAPSYSGLRAVFVDELRRPTTVEGYYQPLTMASLMLDSWLSGAPQNPPDAAVFHRVNVLLHLLNTLLVWLFLRACGVPSWAGLGLAALFGIHPVQVESVAWISQRKTLLATLFSLTSLGCYLRGHASARPSAWFMLCALAYAAAVLSKPTALPLPLVMLLLDAWPLQRTSLGTFFEKIPLLVMMVAAGAIAAASQRESAWLGLPGLSEAPRVVALSMRNLSSLIGRLVWPVDLAPMLPIPRDVGSWNARGVAGVLIAAGCAAACIVWRRRAPALAVGLAAFLLLVAPGLGLLGFSDALAGDRFLYLPLALLMIPPGIWLGARAAPRRVAPWMALGVIVLALVAAAQVQVWRNGETLYRHMLAVSPRHPAALAGLADWLTISGRVEEAIGMLNDAVATDPAAGDHWYLLGNAYLAASRRDEALAAYRRALETQPERAAYLQGVGAALSASGKYAEALPFYEKASERSPRSDSILMGLGYTYLELDRPASARKQFQLAFDLRPDEPLIHYGLACAYAAMDVRPQCRAHLAAAVASNPGLAARAGRDRFLSRWAGEADFNGLIR